MCRYTQLLRDMSKRLHINRKKTVARRQGGGAWEWGMEQKGMNEQ